MELLPQPILHWDQMQDLLLRLPWFRVRAGEGLAWGQALVAVAVGVVVQAWAALAQAWCFWGLLLVRVRRGAVLGCVRRRGFPKLRAARSNGCVRGRDLRVCWGSVKEVARLQDDVQSLCFHQVVSG